MNSQHIGAELETYRPEVFETQDGEILAVRFDARHLLETNVGPDWQERSCNAILNEGQFIAKTGEHETVREPVGSFGLITLEGDKFAELMPGILKLYREEFKQMMEASLPAGLEPLHAYDSPTFGLEAVAQPPANPASHTQNRYEAHVDQRYTAVLVLDAPSTPEQGGRLVISNRPDEPNTEHTLEEINADATFIKHEPGTIVCFSQGRFYRHYTEEVTDPTARRVTISLNYPVEGETPEAAQALLDHNMGTANG